ncbi:hypothetical protein VB776_16625 [Arcicella sp. DC2W]|uniref:O-antigen ligase domain-containing protein n=1 Tax=Arcicella gelida TaxID=2984195 RepID=A0ABU5S815_9BACT|nr:hypothetical protein [Arcicella sp. DC2W]MEA5404559.1 hypothetical protein [Arcicella sp. DC2W]
MRNKIRVVVFIILVSIRFWSFQIIPDSYFDVLDLVCISYMVFISITQKHKLVFKGMFLHKNILWMLFFILFSTVPAFLVHNQSFFYSLLALRMMGYWLFYYVLHCYSIDSKVILKILATIAVIWVTLLIVQQFTYPTIYFYTRGLGINGKEIEIRNYMYRFMTLRHHYAMICVILFFIYYLKTRKLSWLMISIYCLLGMYVFSTRQYLSATVLGMFLSIFFLKGSSKVYGVILSVFIAVVAIYNLNALFGETIAKTQGELNETNVRYLAYNYFLFEFSDSTIGYIFGNGLAHDYSSYGERVTKINELGLYQADIGLIGSYSKFGIFYVICVLAIHFRIIFYKMSKNGLYLRIFMIINLILLSLSDFFTVPSAIPFYCIVFYLFDKSLHEQKISIYEQKESLRLPNNT